ncbi:MAG: hypothetical protein ACXWQO_10735, partial [Bdellovibrionota bacterium]
CACGTEPTNSGGSSGGDIPPGDAPGGKSFGALNGVSLSEFMVGTVGILSGQSNQSRAELARALDKKWKLNCDQRCQISERN